MRLFRTARLACPSRGVNGSSEVEMITLLLLEPPHRLRKAADLPLTIRSSLERYSYLIVKMSDRELHVFLIPLALRTDILHPFI